MAAAGSRVADILIKAGVIDEWQARSALARQTQWGGRLGKHIAEMGFATEEAIAEALATACGLQRIELGLLPKDAAALAKVDHTLAEERGVFPYGLRDNGKTLWLAMADPCDIETVDLIAAKTGVRVRATVAGEREIVVAIYRHYKNQAPPAGLLGENSTRMRTLPPGGLEVYAATAAVEAMRRATPAPRQATQLPRQPTPPPVAAPLPRIGTPPPGSVPTEFPAEVAASLPPAVADYVRRLQVDLDKTTRVLRALLEVCIEKQLFTSEDVRAAAARIVGK
jgi:hypothetical protein